MDDFYDWVEKKGKWAVCLCEGIVTFGMTFLFCYLILVS